MYQQQMFFLQNDDIDSMIGTRIENLYDVCNIIWQWKQKSTNKEQKSNLKKNRFSLGYSLENLHMAENDKAN